MLWLLRKQRRHITLKEALGKWVEAKAKATEKAKAKTAATAAAKAMKVAELKAQ
jgi:hypothetical protein